MAKEVSLFGSWLLERGVPLESYANMPVAEKRKLEDLYESEGWRKRSDAAAVEAAQVPANFEAYLRAVKNITREEFNKLSASAQNNLVNEHSFALAAAQKTVETANRKPTKLPDGWDQMSTGAQLRYLNKRALEDAGVIPRKDAD